MAEKPKFYPILPRKPKSRPRGASVNNSTPTLYTKRIKADWLIKSSGFYNPNLINTTMSANIGSSVKSGTKNPGWRVTIAKGGDATSNYSRTGYHVKPTTYTVKTESNAYLSQGFGTYAGDISILERDTTALDDKALSRIKNRLQGKVGNAKLGPPLAESREIHRLVRQINGLGMSTFKALLAAKVSHGKSLTKQLSDIWLGFGFGVNPLLQDIKSAADSILHYITREDQRVIVSGSATQDYASGYPAPKTYSLAGEVIAYNTKIGFSATSSHVQGIRYEAAYDLAIRSSGNYSVADHLGLKLGELPSILWELTPYSWVVDYGTTVGAWLDDVFYTVPGTCIYALKNYKYHVETTAYPMAIADTGLTTSFSGKPTVVRYFNFSRTKIAGLPTRSLRIKSVDEVANHGITKMLNLAAVIAGRRGPSF